MILSQQYSSNVIQTSHLSKKLDMNADPSFLDDDDQFQHPDYANGDASIYPRLDPISTDDVSSDTLAIAEAQQQMLSPVFWNTSMGNQMAFFDDEMPEASSTMTTKRNSEQWDPSDNTVTSTNATQTRSPSAPSSRDLRTRSLTSSRSSVPSANSGSADSNSKARKAKQQSTRARKQSNASNSSRKNSQQDSGGEGDGTKRDKFLERNRIAASKCRQKKKEWVSDLEETKHSLENRNNNLHMEHNALVSELTKMKNILMGHAGCHDPKIDQWIDNEARRFVQHAAGQMDNLFTSKAVHRDHSRRESLVMQPSPDASMTTHSTPPQPKQEEIEYDHMPDAMFDD